MEQYELTSTTLTICAHCWHRAADGSVCCHCGATKDTHGPFKPKDSGYTWSGECLK